jgi:hypothetical protein
VLIRGLPDHSRHVTHTAGGWTIEREMQAQTVDLLNWVLHVLVKANTKKSKAKSIPKPQPFPRPAELTPKKLSYAQRMLQVARRFASKGAD